MSAFDPFSKDGCVLCNGNINNQNSVHTVS